MLMTARHAALKSFKNNRNPRFPHGARRRELQQRVGNGAKLRSPCGFETHQNKQAQTKKPASDKTESKTTEEKAPEPKAA